jgi:uncharacterized membrane protein YccC
MMLTFLRCSALGVAISGFYLFVVLPTGQDFAVLAIYFASVFVPLGLLMARPKWALVSTLVALTTATFLGIGDAYDANFLTFTNGNLAGLAGVIFASIVTGVIRPFGTSAAVGRLTRSTWRDVILSGAGLADTEQRDLSARMLDRLMQLVPRVQPSGTDRHPATESLRDMRIALNMLDLRRLARKLRREAPAALDRVLDGVRLHYQQCLESKRRLDVRADLAVEIDATISQIMAVFAADLVVPGIKQRREALHALIGLRLSLFPGGKPVATTS